MCLIQRETEAHRERERDLETQSGGVRERDTENRQRMMLPPVSARVRCLKHVGRVPILILC